MFPAWRLRIREARTAVADGRWDDAAEMLSSHALRQYLPAKRLSMELAGHLIRRAQERIGGSESSAGWRDLDRAALLGGSDAEIRKIRLTEEEKRLRQAIDSLLQGDTSAALVELHQMHRRGLGGGNRAKWEKVAELLQDAERLAARGRFDDAASRLATVAPRLPDNADRRLADWTARQQKEYAKLAGTLTKLEQRLHRAIEKQKWNEALANVDEILRIAPRHTAARQARRKAWKAVGMDVTQAYAPGLCNESPVPWEGRSEQAWSIRSTRRHAASAKEDTVSPKRHAGKRLATWIDAVGGYMICLGDEVVLGQPSSDGGVDVPLLADLSRRHATIRRESESYVLQPIHSCTLDGQPINGPVVLRDKAVVGLGDSVKIRFRQPHALSATAVLEVLSSHKTDPALDGIVLMSDTCIMGSQSHSHIRCRDWQHEIVLFRRGDKLFCRTQAEAQIDGQSLAGQVELRQDCRIEGEEFALSFEEI